MQDFSFVLYSQISFMFLLGLVVLYFVLRMPSILMSSIPNNAGLPFGTTENLPNLCICVYLTEMLHTPN